MVTTDAPRPPWLRVRFPGGSGFGQVQGLVKSQSLHTVCEEAHCPNIGDCWSRGTATFMILGDVCTRSCGFCAIKTGRPEFLDKEEPARVAAAVSEMGLRHAVITSVNRDELPDGGAAIFADTVTAIRRLSPTTTIEVLIPDFKGDLDALSLVMAAEPEILNHNIETVPRLYGPVRPQAIYERSLAVLKAAKTMTAKGLTKSGLMVGFGETLPEVIAVLRDLRAHDVDIVTVGQYLRPTAEHLPVERYWHPDQFATIRDVGYSLGFRHVESGPLVRSSYHADEQAGHAAENADFIPLEPVEHPLAT